MSRFNKFLSLAILILFILACNTVTGPISDAQNLAGTAQSFASALPMATLQALASEIPVETLQALPSAAPTIEAIASQLPDFNSYLDPHGEPVSAWNDIPVMSQATAGQEFTDTNTYSFRVDATVEDAENFYKDELPKLGWNALPFGSTSTDTMAFMVYQKENNILNVTVNNINGDVTVILTLI